MSDDNEQARIAEYQRYLDYRQQLLDVRTEQINRFDRLVVSLSGGALAVSIAFIDKIAPAPVAESTYWLAMGWCAFILSIVATLASHLASQWDMDLEISRVDKRISSYEECVEQVNWWRRITTFLNILSASSFVLGAASVTAFTFVNLP